MPTRVGCEGNHEAESLRTWQDCSGVHPEEGDWVRRGLKLVLGFGNWEVVGDLRGSSCKSGTGEAIRLGSVLAVKGRRGQVLAGRRGSTEVIGFLLWMFPPLFLRAAGPLGQKELFGGVRGPGTREQG